MYKKLKYSLLAIFALATIATSVLPVSPVAARVPCPDGTHGPGEPQCTPNAPIPSDCPERILTFPSWYKGVIDRSTCEIKIDSILDLIKIPLNFIEILIQGAAYVAVGYIVWGGFKYIKSQGDPGKISEAKTAIINAVTGLAIALLSVAIVEFIQGRFS